MDLGLRAPNVVSQLKISLEQILSGNTWVDSFTCACVYTHTRTDCAYIHFQSYRPGTMFAYQSQGGSLPSLPFSHHPMDAQTSG